MQGMSMAAGKLPPGNTSTSGSQKLRGLRRPKKPLNFQITNLQTSTPMMTTTTTTGMSGPASPTAHPTLEKHVLLLDLIHRRNKNQHRSQAFFKHLCLLRSSLKRLLETQIQLGKLARGPPSSNADRVRWRFEQESRLRGSREVLQEHIRETLVPMCYISFSGLVGDPQFANLGVVLFGLLGDIAAGEGGVGVPRKSDQVEAGMEARDTAYGKGGDGAEKRGEPGSKQTRSSTGTSTRVTGEDQGEIIERIYESGDGGEADVPAGSIEEAISGSGSGEEQWRQGQGLVSETQESTAGPGTRRGTRAIKGSSTTLVEPSRKDREETNTKKKKRKTTIDDLFSGLI